MNWIKMREHFPEEDEPVLVAIGRHIQNITYELRRCDVTDDLRWFASHNDEVDSAPMETFDSWMSLSALPQPPGE